MARRAGAGSTIMHLALNFSLSSDGLKRKARLSVYLRCRVNGERMFAHTLPIKAQRGFSLRIFHSLRIWLCHAKNLRGWGAYYMRRCI